MDITDALAPTSDQLDAVELVNPRTFTIDTGSKLGSRDGKTVAEIKLVGFPRVWRPSKGMLDVLAACWGTDGRQWTGRSVTLYNDPSVMYGKDRVGGIRISHLSHIDKACDVTIRANGAGRKRQWHVEPLRQDSRRDHASGDAPAVEEGTPVGTGAVPSTGSVGSEQLPIDPVGPSVLAGARAQLRGQQIATIREEFERLLGAPLDGDEVNWWSGLIVGHPVTGPDDLETDDLRKMQARLPRFHDRQQLETELGGRQ